MKTLSAALGLAWFAASLLFTGCTAADPAESALPQARPASWEGTPAMVGSPGRSGY
jgi:hypothetical protein